MAVKLASERTGDSRGVCRWMGRFYLSITFLIGGETTLALGKRFFLAQGTAAESMLKDINGGLFWKLEEGGFTEKIREEFSAFLLDKFEAGSVTEEDMRQKLTELLYKK